MRAPGQRCAAPPCPAHSAPSRPAGRGGSHPEAPAVRRPTPGWRRHRSSRAARACTARAGGARATWQTCREGWDGVGWCVRVCECAWRRRPSCWAVRREQRRRASKHLPRCSHSASCRSYCYSSEGGPSHLAAAMSSRLRSGQPGFSGSVLLSATARKSRGPPLVPLACCCRVFHAVRGAVAMPAPVLSASASTRTSQAGRPEEEACEEHAAASAAATPFAAASPPSAAGRLTGGAARANGCGGCSAGKANQ